MKNEYDLLAYIRRQLTAGVSLVTVHLEYFPADSERWGIDDTGQTYALGPEFMQELFPFLRTFQVPFSLGGKPGSTRTTLRIGPGLPPRSEPPGSVNLLDSNILPSAHFGILPEEPDDSEQGEEWKRLL